MAKLNSGRVVRTPQNRITADRYQFLGLEQAEPNLGDPLVGPSSVTAKPLPVGQYYTVIGVGTQPGERYWASGVGVGTTLGLISVYDNSILPSNAFGRIGALDFVGTGVTVETSSYEIFPGIGIATVRIAVDKLLNQGQIGEFIVNKPGGFASGTSDLFYNYLNGNIGVGSTNPAYRLDVNGTGRFTGNLIAPSFIGDLSGTATTATNLSNASGIITGFISSERLEGYYPISVNYALEAGNIAGIAKTAINVIGGIGSITSLYVGGGAVIAGIGTTIGFVLEGYLATDADNIETSSGTSTSVLMSRGPGLGVTWVKVIDAALYGIQGVQGIQGTQGVQGIQGIQGIQGPIGIQGVQGTQGVQGIQGIQGISGVLGIQGTDGLQGIQGIQGTQGVQGIQGVKGDQGIQGIQGIQGTQGVQGIAGDGVQGVQGRQGIQGIQGDQGVQGIQGISGGGGVQGIQGTSGIQGIQGIQGAQGEQGIQGVQGTTGLQGVQGIQGVSGTSVQGTGGIQGIQGIQGVQGATGLQGIQGTTGLQGVQGTTGLQGIQGIQGSSGTGIQGATGLQGIQGVQGATGLQGIQGTTGLQGIQGTTGLQGLQGTTGLQGIQGTTGLQGSTGLQGIQGIQGVQGGGLQGIQGTTGLQGIQGSTGLQGIQGGGIQGIQGTRGIQGTDGLQGLQGTRGLQGIQGTFGPATVPQNLPTTPNPYVLQLSDSGKHIRVFTPVTGVTVPASIFSAGDNIVIYNANTTSINITKQSAGVVLRFAGTTFDADRVLVAYGVATILCVGANEFVISGSGLV